MKSIKSDYKMLMVLFLSLWFNLALGGGKSSDQKSSASLGSYKTIEISASPEYSAKYKRPPKGDPVDMAYQFFELNKSSFSIPNPREELIPKYQAFDKISGVISFQQVYKGVPIQYSDITVRFTGSGELRSVEGDYHYDINLSTNYSMDSLTAVQRTLKDIGPIPDSSVPRVSCPNKPIIVHSSELDRRDEDKLYLIWPVSVYLVTAESAKQDTIRYQDGTITVMPEIVTGLGYAYYFDALNGSILKKGETSTLTDMWKTPYHRVPTPKR